MKEIENLGFLTKKGTISQAKSLEESAETKDFIEYALDVVPHGGFSPKDIRDRSRIQAVLDEHESGELAFEDADFTNLKAIVESSRWGSRNKDVSDFINQFE